MPVSADNLARLRQNPDEIEEFLYPDGGEGEPDGVVDIDKAWHGIHYLLTGTADGGDEPLSLAVLGGEEFGEDMGMGPARFLTPAQVRQIASALAGLSKEVLAERFVPQDMADQRIYPDVIWMREGQGAFDFLMESYAAMATLYRDAAARDDAMILWLA